MKLKDVPRIKIKKHMAREVKEMQKKAPHLLRHIIEKTNAFPEVPSFTMLEPSAVKVLTGGVASVLYSLKTPERIVVIKIRKDGVDAEYESLEAWRKHGVSVPTIRKKGVLPSIQGLPPMKYLLLDYIVDSKGETAPTGITYIRKNPRRARRIGQLLGRTLARIHRAKTDRTFGEFADMSGSNRSPLRSWNKYLLGYLTLHRRYLTKLGISKKLLQALARTIKETRFSSTGTYLHGDYSLRNVMIESARPLKMVVFDPNPLIGDPSWDIAILFNNRDYRRKTYEWQPRNAEYRKEYKREERLFDGFWSSYKLSSTDTMSLEKIRIAQLIQTIVHLQAKELEHNPDKEEKNLGIRVRREALFERFGSLQLEEQLINLNFRSI